MVTRLDLVDKGTYSRRAPKGRFPLAIAFTLADGRDAAETVSRRRAPADGCRGISSNRAG